MPVPKRKRSRARRDSRFANKGIKPKSLTECANCKEPLATHAACRACGHYKGKKVLATKADREVKRAQTRTAKQARKSEAELREAETGDKQ
jgi:large subunit ribosomal protein L32